jgi:hypothetical protein
MRHTRPSQRDRVDAHLADELTAVKEHHRLGYARNADIVDTLGRDGGAILTPSLHVVTRSVNS